MHLALGPDLLGIYFIKFIKINFHLNFKSETNLLKFHF